MSLRILLRSATRPDHERVDALGETFDLASPDGYGAFLLAHARALPPLEAAVERSGFLPPDWPERRRTAALTSDLARLGLAFPRPLPRPDLPRMAMNLGALYVLEGSRLGGALLARRLAAAQPSAPSAYLRHGEGQPFWRDFLVWLEAMGPEGRETDVIEGARRAFATFETAFTEAIAPAAMPAASS